MDIVGKILFKSMEIVINAWNNEKLPKLFLFR